MATGSAAAVLMAALAFAADMPKPPTRPNIILVGWDTLRADRVGPRAGRESLTPDLDALARKGSLFTEAVSPSSWTLPVFMSWFTSLMPSRHGMTNKFRITEGPKPELAPHSLDKKFITLPQALKARGYKTVGFTGGAGVSAEFGFDRGFDVYKGSVNFAGFSVTVSQALEWLDTRPTTPFFLFVHGYDCHPQAELPNGADPVFKERHPGYRMDGIDGKTVHPREGDVALWNRVYDRKVRVSDQELGKLLRRVESSLELRDRTLIVVAGDHGDELFEHGHVDHGMTLYDEVIHVPLVVFAPWVPARLVSKQVRTLDIMPTILDLAGLEPDARLRRQMQGTSLVALMRGSGSALDAYSETDFLLHAKLRSLRKPDGWKLIHDELKDAWMLFDLRADPGETRNLYEKESARAYEMESALAR